LFLFYFLILRNLCGYTIYCRRRDASSTSIILSGTEAEREKVPVVLLCQTIANAHQRPKETFGKFNHYLDFRDPFPCFSFKLFCKIWLN